MKYPWWWDSYYWPVRRKKGKEFLRGDLMVAWWSRPAKFPPRTPPPTQDVVVYS